MTSNQQTFSNAMNRGHTAAWEQKWEEAAGYYRQALQEFPNHPQALNSLGLALFELHHYDEALVCYQKASQVSSDDPVPFEKIAEIYDLLGNPSESAKASGEAAELYLKNRDVEKAIESWRRAVSLQPNHLAAYLRLASAYERTGRPRESVKAYLAAASLLQRMGNQEKALQALEHCQQLLPNDSEVEQAVASVRSHRPLPPPTPEPVAAALPKNTPADSPQTGDDTHRFLDIVSAARQKALASLAEMLFVEAERTLDLEKDAHSRKTTRLVLPSGLQLLRPTEKQTATLNIGQALQSYTQGQRHQAARELEEVLKTGLDEPVIYFTLGLLQSEVGQEWAINNLRKAAESPEYALASHLLMAQLYEKKHSFSEAVTAYLQALCLADMETVLPTEAGALRQRYEMIIANYDREKDPAVLQQICDHISEQLLRSDWREHLKIARQNLPVHPGDSGPQPLVELLLHSHSSQAIEALSLIRQLVNRGQYRSAMEEAFHAVQKAPTYLPLHIEIANILMEEKHIPEAIRKYQLVADLYQVRGEHSETIRLLERVVQMAPTDYSTRQRLIELLLSQGQNDKAIQQYMELALIYYRLGELKLARQAYTITLRLAQQSKSEDSLLVEILHKIADIDLQQLDFSQALKVYLQILSLAPTDETARAELIGLNFRMDQDATAFNELDELVALYENSGRRSQAIEFLKELIVEWPDKLELNRHLAHIYSHDGRKSLAVQQLDTLADGLLSAERRPEAIATLQEIIALEPDNVAEYREALRQLQKK